MADPTTAINTSHSPTDVVPTSHAQDAWWLLEHLVPDSAEHRVAWQYRISGRLRVDRLRSAWLAVLHRHEILRSSIADAGGRPHQRATVPAADTFSVVDLTLLDWPGRQRRAEELSAALAAGRLSVTAGPMIQLTVVRVAADAHHAVLVVHRAVADERSVALLVDEVSSEYAEAPPRPPALRYADFARRERERSEADLLRWWAAELTPLPAPVALPGDRHTPDERSPGGVLPFDWGTGFGRRLTAWCQAGKEGQSTVLLAAWLAVLGRYAAGEPVAVGVTTTVRPPEFAGVVGPFDNLLVVGADLTGAPSFRQFVRRVAATAEAALEHREMPFGRLLAGLDVDREPGRAPLSDVRFEYRTDPMPSLRLAGADVMGRRIDAAPARSELTVTVRQVHPSVTGTVGYRGGAAGRAVAALVLAHVRTLLDAALAAPDRPVPDLPMDDMLRTRRIAATSDRIADGPPGVPVHELVRRHGEDSGAIAVGTTTYRELLRRAAAIAARLDAPGAPVAIRMPHGAPHLAASLGVLHGGGHLIWLGTGEAGERARAVLTEQRPAALLVAGDPAADELATWFRGELGGRVLDVLTFWDEDAAGDGGGAAVAADRPAYVAHTSGSTGRPKGIAQTHGALSQFVSWMGDAFGLGPGARVAQWVAADHDPSLCEVFATLVAGGTLCPVPERARVHPERFVAWLAEERVTFLQTVPSFAREVLAAIRATGAAGRLALDHLVLMGEAVPGELVLALRATLPGTRVVNIYGPTETIAATWCELGPGLVDEGTAVVPIGAAIPGRRVLVVDEDDRPCPTGVTGEIVICGPHVADGYVGDPASGSFRPLAEQGGRCYRTGDLARRRPDGLLEFRGRRDQQVKLQGNRLELAEIEAALAADDSVAECVVVPRKDRDGLVVQLVAYVVARPGDDAAAGPPRWRATLRTRFGRQLPILFEPFPGRLPRNIAGKVDRRRLPAPRALAAEAARPPQTALEQDVAELFAQLLGVPRVGAHETFFAVGGHSLQLMQLVHRVRERFGVALSLADCLAGPTVAALSARIAAAGTPRTPSGRPAGAEQPAPSGRPPAAGTPPTPSGRPAGAEQPAPSGRPPGAEQPVEELR
ncbi:AMP-binding protein [Dactylosporangium sp. NPDC049140]|uniref:non-ribosomal peptide synthetase n=1 Tax=Dactylosporangium sp. NPDC049140 TaxID=3155647 RepID=UPI0033FF493B